MTAGYDSAAEDRSRTKRRTADQGDSYTTDQGWFVHSSLDDEQHHPTIVRRASGPRTRPCWMVTTRDRRRITPQFVAYLETGMRKPSDDTVERLITAMDLPPRTAGLFRRMAAAER